MEKKTKKQINDGLKKIGNTIDDLTNKLELQAELERREIYKQTAINLLTFRLNTSSCSLSECMDWAVDNANVFSRKVMERITDDSCSAKMTDDEVVKEFHDRKLIDDALTDNDIVKEVYDRGLVADVLYTNEELVETYGWVKKSDTEF